MGKASREEQQKRDTRLAMQKEEVPIHDPFPVCPSKSMSQAEIDKSVERLYKVSAEEKEGMKSELTQKYYAKPEQAKLTGDDLLASVDRQYTQEMERRKERMEESKKRWLFHSKAKPKVVSNAEFVQRMYADRIEQKKATEKKLYDKYIATTENHTPNMNRED